MSISNLMTTKIKNRISPLTFIIHFAFLICGIITVLIGQILPVLSKRLSLNDAQAGWLFTAQFSGSFCGTLIFGYTAKRFGFIKTTIFGFILITAGCLLLNSDSWLVCVLGLFINGLGIGSSLPSINMLVVILNPERKAAALSILNFFWGVGAIISQPFVAFFGTATSIFVPTVMLSVLFFLTMLALFFFRIPTGETKAETETNGISGSKIWSNPLAWMIAAFNFVHVGFESGAGGWLTTYSERFPEGANSLLSATPAFFLFFVIGRGIAPVFLRFLSENKFLFSSVIILITGTIVISWAEKFHDSGYRREHFRFRNVGDFSGEYGAVHQHFRGKRDAPSDAAVSFGNARRRVCDAAHRLRIGKIRESAKRNFCSLSKRFDSAGFTNHHRYKFA